MATIGNLFRKHRRFDVSGEDCTHRSREATCLTRGSEDTIEPSEQFRSLNIQEKEGDQEAVEPVKETLVTKSSFEELAVLETTPTLCQFNVETSSRNQSMSSDQDKLIGDEELMDTREGDCFISP